MSPASAIAPAVARYAATVHAAAPAAHHVVSPLGAWLVLALAASAAEPAEVPAPLADALGMPPEDAARLAGALLDAPHPAVASAVGLWWRHDVVTDRLTAYLARLPRGATREPLTDQARLDAWTRDHTLGLVDRFPVQLRRDLLLVLASALATRVRWRELFDLVPAAELAGGGPFAAAVTSALRSVRGHDVRLVRTRAAGVVGAHVAASADGLAVVSVLAAPDADRAGALAAAHEVALGLRDGAIGDHLSLFDLPAGTGDVGEIVEDSVMAGRSPRERGVAVLPSWRARSEVDLLDGPAAPGFAAAGEALADLLPPARTVLEARQVALASYTREGFEAAAVTAVGVRMAAVVSATEVPRRTLHLRFDRPYAVVAVAVRPEPEGAAAAVAEGWYGLPVFSAWVAEPAESS